MKPLGLIMFYDLAGQQRTLWGGVGCEQIHIYWCELKKCDTIQKLCNSAPGDTPVEWHAHAHSQACTTQWPLTLTGVP